MRNSSLLFASLISLTSLAHAQEVNVQVDGVVASIDGFTQPIPMPYAQVAIGDSLRLEFKIDEIGPLLTNEIVQNSLLITVPSGQDSAANSNDWYYGLIDDGFAGDTIGIAPFVMQSGMTLNWSTGDLGGSMLHSFDPRDHVGLLEMSSLAFSHLALKLGSEEIQMDVTSIRIFPEALGTNYCGPAVPNSTGQSGFIRAFGSRFASDNDLILVGSELPENQFGIFLGSQTQDFVVMPGNSQGNLCLGGGVARFNRPGEVGQVQGGALELPINMGNVPEPPMFNTMIVSGQTWHFQCWTRDWVAGAPSSNFTQAVRITFL